MIEPGRRERLATLILELNENELAQLDIVKELGMTITDPTDPRVLELQVNMATIGDQVRISFGQRVSWIQMTNAQALQFALLVLAHAGAKVDKTLIPEGPPA